MQRLIVLGTNTSVGKTWLTCALARTAPAGSCLALKPVETGVGDDPSGTDAALLRAAAGSGPSGPLYAFAPPVTPRLAAATAGVEIDLNRIATWVRDAETLLPRTALHYATCLVETAGGVFSPLSRRASNYELASALEPARWLLVAADQLGVLHQVSATLLAMEHRGRRPDLVLLSEPALRDASTESNLALLRDLHPETEFAALGRDDMRAVRRLYQRLVGGDGP